MSDETTHPAIQANINSVDLAMKGDREGWLALYDDNAVVQDPVGVSPFDSAGKGHIGKEAIAKFWDTVIGPANLTITVHNRIPSGKNNVAVRQTAVNDMGNGIKTSIEMIATYDLNDEGKITRMSAFWDWDALEAQLKGLGLM